MNVSMSIENISTISAFKGCTDNTLQRISNEGSAVTFGVGQIMSSSSIIPNRVLILLKGKARLLGKSGGKLSTLGIYKPGSLIGLPSLLRAEACEDVSASTLVETWSIKDSLVAEIYAEDACFKNWCDTTLFPAEAAKLAESILEKSVKSEYEILNVLNQVMSEGKIEALSKSVQIEDNSVKLTVV